MLILWEDFKLLSFYSNWLDFIFLHYYLIFFRILLFPYELTYSKICLHGIATLPLLRWLGVILPQSVEMSRYLVSVSVCFSSFSIIKILQITFVPFLFSNLFFYF